MKNWIRKIWDAFVALIYKIPADKWLHFFAGVIIAAFCEITLHVEWCWWPVLFAAAGKEFFDAWTTGQADWKDFVATVIGGLLIWGFALLG